MHRPFAAALFLGITLPALAGPEPERPAPKPITLADALSRAAGEEVAIEFRVREAAWLSGTVPKDQPRTFALFAESRPDEPRFSLLVAGQLVRDMQRLGIRTEPPDDHFNGRLVRVTGTLTRSEPTKDSPDRQPSLQMTVRALDKFLVVH